MAQHRGARPDHGDPVAAVQQAMTSNWTTAVKTLGLPMIPAGYTG